MFLLSIESVENDCAVIGGKRETVNCAVVGEKRETVDCAVVGGQRLKSECKNCLYRPTLRCTSCYVLRCR